MRSWFVGVLLALTGLSVFFGPGILLLAQAPSGAVHGLVSDPSKATVPDAAVSAVSSTGQTKAGVVNKDGTYDIRGLAPGKYMVKVQAKGFTPFQKADVQVVEGQTQKLDIALQIEEEREQVTVSDSATKVGIAPDENASAPVIKGEDLQALSDDPDELQSELEALAGPSAGPNGGQIYVDGFTAGQFPPKRTSWKSASTRIRFPPNMTGWAMGASKSPRGRAPVSSMARSWVTSMPRLSTRATLS